MNPRPPQPPADRESTLVSLGPAAPRPPAPRDATFVSLGEVGPSDTLVPPATPAPNPDADTSVTAPLLGASAPPLPPGVPPDVGRYRVLGKVGAGGIGVVCRAFEPSLGRDVAVKLLLPNFRSDPGTVRRFRDEAQITGRLQHPGIPPVFEVGELPDGSPFLAMKLIHGRDLATILKGEEWHDGRPAAAAVARLVPVFEKICQAVGFAHAQHIIHRDLKPSNVMVGAFGEVQVMDWGLAKEVRTPHPEADAATHADLTAIPHPEFRTPHSREDATQAGSVLGTPSYMAPEQARGAADLDARADVFALGGVLCAILTGQPPFTGGEAWATVALAATGDVSAAFDRLDKTGADPDLVALAKRCLNPDPGGRPADGGAVAGLVADLRAAAAERAHRAEVERVAAVARAEADRKRRQSQYYLALSALAIVGLAGFVAWWQTAVEAQHDKDRFALETANAKTAADLRETQLQREKDAADTRARAAEREQHQREDRARRLERVRLGVQRLIGESASLRDRALWSDAAAALTQADRLLDPAGEPAVADWDSRPELVQDVADARRDLGFVTRLDKVRLSKWLFLAARDNVPQTLADYRAAFAAAGFDVLGGDPADLVEKIRASAVRPHLVAALDDWGFREGREVRTRLIELTAGATGQGWRRALAEASLDPDPRRLEKAYDGMPLDQVSASLFFAVGREALRRGRERFGVRVIEDGLRRHPSDLWLLYFRSITGREDQTERKVAASWTALAIRPDVGAVHFNLGNALMDRRDPDGAIAAYERALALDRTLARARSSLAVAMVEKCKAMMNEAARKADAPAQARALEDGAKALFDEAIRHLDRAIEDDRTDGFIRFHLGIALAQAGKKAAAAREYRAAIALDPTLVGPRYELGSLSWEAGDVAEAVAQFREVVFLDPDNFEANYRLGLALAVWDWPKAGYYFRRAIRLNPSSAGPRLELGTLLYDRGDKAWAEVEIRGAVRVAPTDPRTHDYLAGVLAGIGTPEARAEARAERAEAARLRAAAPKAAAPRPAAAVD